MDLEYPVPVKPLNGFTLRKSGSCYKKQIFCSRNMVPVPFSYNPYLFEAYESPSLYQFLFIKLHVILLYCLPPLPPSRIMLLMDILWYSKCIVSSAQFFFMNLSGTLPANNKLLSGTPSSQKQVVVELVIGQYP